MVGPVRRLLVEPGSRGRGVWALEGRCGPVEQQGRVEDTLTPCQRLEGPVEYIPTYRVR